MKVDIKRDVEDSSDQITAIEFRVGGKNENFKAEIMKWLNANYPDMAPSEFWQRLMVFQGNGFCSINMEPLQKPESE